MWWLSTVLVNGVVCIVGDVSVGLFGLKIVVVPGLEVVVADPVGGLGIMAVR